MPLEKLTDYIYRPPLLFPPPIESVARLVIPIAQALRSLYELGHFHLGNRIAISHSLVETRLCGWN